MWLISNQQTALRTGLHILILALTGLICQLSVASAEQVINEATFTYSWDIFDADSIRAEDNCQGNTHEGTIGAYAYNISGLVLVESKAKADFGCVHETELL